MSAPCESIDREQGCDVLFQSYDFDRETLKESLAKTIETCHETNDKNYEVAEFSALGVLESRVGLLGTLQRASTSAPESDYLSALSNLALETKLQMDHDEKRLPLQSIWTHKRIGQIESANQKSSQSTHSLENLKSADVVAFFEAYPDCVQKCFHDCDDESSSTSSSTFDEDEYQRLHQKRNRLMTLKEVPSRQYGSLVVAMECPADSIPSKPNSSHSQHSNARDSHFSYTATNPDESSLVSLKNSRCQPLSNSLIQSEESANQPSTVMMREQKQKMHSIETSNHLSARNPYAPQLRAPLNHSCAMPSSHRQNSVPTSWEDHNVQQNPFQTAAEYAKANHEIKHHHRSSQCPSTNHTKEAGSKGPQTFARGDNRYNYNGSHLRHQHQSHSQTRGANPHPMTESFVEKPHIRDSLKRKFQNPKKGATNQKNPKAKTSLACRPTQQQQHKPDAAVDNDNEDDLPEELKRFGKDLVEKIESEIMDGGEPVTFNDIAGLQYAKDLVKEMIVWPMKRPDIFTGLRRAPKGLLLFGPPGTGKTLVGKAIAHESGATFFSISSSSLTSKWIGEGEKLVRTMFAVAAYREPAVVFIDEIDSLLTQRKSDDNEASRRIKTEFLVQMDGTGSAGQGRVLTIGATNRPQELDEAARRRFIKRLYIPLPSQEDRLILLNVLLEKNRHNLSDQDLANLSKDTAGFSGADLKALCNDAAMGPIRSMTAKMMESVNADDIPPITYRHFCQSLRATMPSVSTDDLTQYVEWDSIYGTKFTKADENDDEEN